MAAEENQDHIKGTRYFVQGQERFLESTSEISKKEIEQKFKEVSLEGRTIYDFFLYTFLYFIYFL